MATKTKQNGTALVHTAVLFIFTLFFPSDLAQGQSSDRSWYITPSPVRTNLTAVVMNRNGEGFAIGKYLIQHTERRWMMAPDVPWTSEVKTVLSPGAGILFVSTLEPTNESFLFRFDGKKWDRVAHPLANFITSVNFDPRGIGWLGGWGEMSYFNGNVWTMYPPIPHVSSVLSAVGTSYEDVLIYTSGHGIFQFSGTGWNRILPPDSLHAFLPYEERSFLVINGTAAMVFTRGRWYEHSSHPLLERITTLFRESNGTLWGVGSKGLVVRYDGKEWNAIDVPTTEQLNDIVIEGSSGTIVGNNGMILQMGGMPSAPNGTITAGFRIEQIFYSGKGLDGE